MENWITVKSELPVKEGSYLVSITKQKRYGKHAFNYVGYFKENKWYKYDPFIDEYTPEEEVEGEVIAWGKNLGVFLN